VVISIIALLISILLPSLSKARETARQVKCNTNIRGLVSASHQYANQSDGDWLVPMKNESGALPGGGYHTWYRNPIFLNILNVEGYGWPQYWPEGLFCPNYPGEPNGRGLDAARVYAWNEDHVGGSWSTGHYLQRLAVENPAGKYHFLDGNIYVAWDSYANYNTRWDVHGETHRQAGGAHGVAYRHFTGSDQEGTSIGYIDGHTDYKTKVETWDNINRKVNWNLSAAGLTVPPKN